MHRVHCSWMYSTCHARLQLEILGLLKLLWEISCLLCDMFAMKILLFYLFIFILTFDLFSWLSLNFWSFSRREYYTNLKKLGCYIRHRFPSTETSKIFTKGKSLTCSLIFLTGIKGTQAGFVSIITVFYQWQPIVSTFCEKKNGKRDNYNSVKGAKKSLWCISIHNKRHMLTARQHLPRRVFPVCQYYSIVSLKQRVCLSGRLVIQICQVLKMYGTLWRGYWVA